MTAQIVIMNKEAIALASDSAVTVSRQSGQKIFVSANKLFTLSKYHPVAIMVYGYATFMGVPWETIVKTYRNRLGTTMSATLSEYATDFIKYLDNGNPLFPDSAQKAYMAHYIASYFLLIRNEIKNSVQTILTETQEIANESLQQVISDVVNTHYEVWQRADNVPSIPKSHNRKILQKHRESIAETITDVFEKLPLSKSHVRQLMKIAANLFSKWPEEVEYETLSGIVVAGFGSEDAFPSVESFNIEGIAENRLKYQKHASQKIDLETSAWIMPFAQQEMVYAFMEGIDPDLERHMDGFLSAIFDKYPEIIADSMQKSNSEKDILTPKLKEVSNKVFKEYQTAIQSYRTEKYVEPVTTVVSMLPKDELAAMAESLVSLTSFKRKITLESETVGGPIDVAVISKGDGFIWIKRKHYFKAELNPQFFANYYRRYESES